jgi:hypothetical protein
MQRCFASWALALASLAVPAAAGAAARSNVFALDRLPKGKSVTIPRPATTLVPINARVQFKATDMPQSLSFVAVNTEGGRTAAIRLAIYDKHADRVSYATIVPGTPFIYPFHAIDPITVIPETRDLTGADLVNLRLQVESNKPLEITH